MANPESRWIPAGQALVGMVRAFASAMQVELAEARRQSEASILRYLAAGHLPARAGSYHCEFQPISGTGHKIEKMPSDKNDCLVIPPEYWRVVIASGAHLEANWHLGEFDLPRYSTDVGSYSGFARNVEFDRTYLPLPSQESGTGALDYTDDPGRPAKGYSLYFAEFERRASHGETLPSLTDEADVLLSWFRQTHPQKAAPTARTIENRIRAAYRQVRNPTK